MTIIFKLKFLALMMMQIALIGICAQAIADGKSIGLNAALIAANLLFGAMNARNFLA